MTDKNLNITPKQTFIGDAAKADKHSDMMALPEFRDAAQVALLEYSYRCASSDAQAATVSAFKLRGAQEFLHLLLNLGMPERPRKPVHEGTLTPPEELLDKP